MFNHTHKTRSLTTSAYRVVRQIARFICKFKTIPITSQLYHFSWNFHSFYPQNLDI